MSASLLPTPAADQDEGEAALPLPGCVAEASSPVARQPLPRLPSAAIPARLPSRRRLSFVTLVPGFWQGGSAGRGRGRGVREEGCCRTPSVWWLALALFWQWVAWIGPISFLQGTARHYYGLNATMVWTTCLSVRGVVSMFASPYLGFVSDQWGRKPVQAWKVFLSTVHYLPMGLMPDVPMRGYLTFSLLVLTGFAGNPFGCAFAYCSDLALRDRGRGLNATIALLLALSFTPACVLAPQACRLLAQTLGEQRMWQCMLALAAGNLVFTLAVLPESLPAPGVDVDSPSSAASSPDAAGQRTVRGQPRLAWNPLTYFRLLLHTDAVPGKTVTTLRRICGVLFCLYFAKWSLIGVIGLYAQQHFGWTPGHASDLITVWGISQCATMAGLARLDRCLGAIVSSRENKISWIGLLCGLLGMTLLGAVPHEAVLFPGMVVGAVSMITYTALTSYAGKLVDASMTGEVQGLVGTTLDLTEIVGPLFFGALLRVSLSPGSALSGLPSCPFLFGSASVLAAMAVMTTLPPIDTMPGEDGLCGGSPVRAEPTPASAAGPGEDKAGAAPEAAARAPGRA